MYIENDWQIPILGQLLVKVRKMISGIGSGRKNIFILISESICFGINLKT